MGSSRWEYMPCHVLAFLAFRSGWRSIVGLSRSVLIPEADPYYESPFLPLNSSVYPQALKQHYSPLYQPEIPARDGAWLSAAVAEANTAAAQGNKRTESFDRGQAYNPMHEGFNNSAAAAYITADGDYNVNCPGEAFDCTMHNTSTCVSYHAGSCMRMPHSD